MESRLPPNSLRDGPFRAASARLCHSNARKAMVTPYPTITKPAAIVRSQARLPFTRPLWHRVSSELPCWSGSAVSSNHPGCLRTRARLLCAKVDSISFEWLGYSCRADLNVSVLSFLLGLRQSCAVADALLPVSIRRKISHPYGEQTAFMAEWAVFVCELC